MHIGTSRGKPGGPIERNTFFKVTPILNFTFASPSFLDYHALAFSLHLAAVNPLVCSKGLHRRTQKAIPAKFLTESDRNILFDFVSSSYFFFLSSF